MIFNFGKKNLIIFGLIIVFLIIFYKYYYSYDNFATPTSKLSEYDTCSNDSSCNQGYCKDNKCICKNGQCSPMITAPTCTGSQTLKYVEPRPNNNFYNYAALRCVKPNGITATENSITCPDYVKTGYVNVPVEPVRYDSDTKFYCGKYNITPK